MAFQRSFAFGEIAPALHGGADPRVYHQALATCRNFLVLRGGGLANRPGTEFVNEVKTSSARTYLAKFVFNSTDSYAIEVGNLYFRFYREGARVTVGTPAAWSAVTTYVIGDIVSSGGTNYYCILGHLNQIPPNATYWYALTSDILEVPTPYATADLANLQYAQSGDIVTITHRSYQPRELRRYQSRWTLTPVSTQPTIAQPDGGAGTAGAAGTLTYRYRVTAIKAGNYEESLPGFAATTAITNATQANPVVVTAAGHGLANGDEVFITGVTGMVEINDLRFTVANVTANTFELQGIDGLGYTAYSANGTVARTWITVPLTAAPTPAAPIALNWTAVADAVEYAVYLDIAGNLKFGFIGITDKNTFNDIGYVSDLSDTHPLERVLFETSGDYPQAVGFHQQRRLFGGSTNEPETLYGSVVGFLSNFAIRSPIQDDDAVTFLLAGRDVSEIRHFREVGSSLVVLTSSCEWTRYGGPDADPFTPFTPNFKQQAYWGSSLVTPIVIGNTLIYVQARGGIVRDLKFQQETGYEGRDLTLLSTHLLEGHVIERMDYSQMPNSIIFCVRGDGTLLAMTYLRELDVWGWHRHDTEDGDGFFEDVICVPETRDPVPGSTSRGKEEDVPYVIVRRVVNGSTVRYVERFASRQMEDYRLDGLFLDSFLTYNGINDTATTVTLTTGAGWTPADLITVTASASVFVAGDVGNGITVWLPSETPTVTRIVITTFVSGTVVRGNPINTVDASLRNVATVFWSRAVDEVTGLSHLEAKDVSILANGVVLSGTVAAGAVSLGALYDVVHVGLPITADVETLDFDLPDQALRQKQKKNRGVSLLVKRSRGIKAGPDADHLTNHVPESGPLETDVFGAEGGVLLSQIVEIPFESTWEKPARVFVRQTDPLPLEILGVIPDGILGG